VCTSLFAWPAACTFAALRGVRRGRRAACLAVYRARQPPSPPAQVALPEPSPRGTPEALLSPILSRLSSTSASRAAPHYAWLRAARVGLSHRAGGAAHAVGTAWPTAGGTGGCSRGGGAKRLL